MIIVGHGPSMAGSKRAAEIDSHDIVIRLKAGLLNEDFGYKTTVMCVSTEVPALINKVEADEYWFYPKNGNFEGAAVINEIVRVQKPVLIPLAYCNRFNEAFRARFANHPNVSTGMAAILIALHRYDPEEITLAGFDTLLDPSIEFARHPDVPSTGLGVLAGHDWEAENRLLKSLKVRIKC